jgi:adenosylhomocysteine nucleosidase
MVIALPTEWGYFKRAFHVHHEYHLDGRRHFKGRFGRLPITVVIGGVGKAKALAASKLLCDADKPSTLLSIGYAGALSPELKRGDIVLSSYSMNDTESTPQAIDLKLAEELKGVADESHEHHVYVSPLYTANRIVARHEEKRQIFEKTKALIVDMESFSVYSEARARGIPFIGIHAITDTAEEDIPALEIINPFLTSNSLWRYPKIFWDLATHPKFVVDLAILNHDAKVAGRNLAHFLKCNSANLGNTVARLASTATDQTSAPSPIAAETSATLV